MGGPQPHCRYRFTLSAESTCHGLSWTQPKGATGGRAAAECEGSMQMTPTDVVYALVTCRYDGLQLPIRQRGLWCLQREPTVFHGRNRDLRGCSSPRICPHPRDWCANCKWDTSRRRTAKLLHQVVSWLSAQRLKSSSNSCCRCRSRRWHLRRAVQQGHLGRRSWRDWRACLTSFRCRTELSAARAGGPGKPLPPGADALDMPVSQLT